MTTIAGAGVCASTGWSQCAGRVNCSRTSKSIYNGSSDFTCEVNKGSSGCTGSICHPMPAWCQGAPAEK